MKCTQGKLTPVYATVDRVDSQEQIQDLTNVGGVKECYVEY